LIILKVTIKSYKSFGESIKLLFKLVIIYCDKSNNNFSLVDLVKVKYEFQFLSKFFIQNQASHFKIIKACS